MGAADAVLDDLARQHWERTNETTWHWLARRWPGG
jgi:hypothetical protein